jgi:hypothetical protein
MRGTLACAVLLLSIFVIGEEDKPITFKFARADDGKVPAGWKSAQTGEGKGSDWKVVADKTAPAKSGYALAQLAEGPTRLFNLCVAEKTNHTDVEVSVKFKAVGGKIDQGGGVVWRYQDADNYYICRYNPLESNFRVYKVVKGKRLQLASKEEIPLKAGQWYTLSISQKGEQITCSLEGKKYLEVKDDTFAKSGPVGLWTKADAVTHFDELTIKGK